MICYLPYIQHAAVPFLEYSNVLSQSETRVIFTSTLPITLTLVYYTPRLALPSPNYAALLMCALISRWSMMPSSKV